jgi:hypothetical protein
MANTVIQIKRSQTTATPSNLANGEIAYSYSSNKLFIGQTDTAASPVSVEYIGGKLLVDKVANLESIVIGGASSGRTFGNVVISNTLTLSNYTNNSVLIVKAGGVIEGITGSSGKLMQIASNNTPVFDDLDGGSF